MLFKSENHLFLLKLYKLNDDVAKILIDPTVHRLIDSVSLAVRPNFLVNYTVRQSFQKFEISTGQ